MALRIHSITVLIWSALLTSGIVARGAVESQRAPAPTYGGSVVQEVGITPRLGQRLPLETTFVDADGQPVRLGDCFANKPVILHLVYYDCPMLCKLSADGLFSTLKTLSLKPADDFTIVTISFDPREGPALSARARDIATARCGEEAVQKGWRFLTGDEASIKSVTDAVGFRYVYDENTRQYAHASGVFVITPEGTLSRYLSGVHFAPRDVRLALVEASDGAIGTPIDQVMMLCYMYDPTVGKYGFAIMTVMRAAGITTVVTMAAAIAIMLRRDRRRMTGFGTCHTERSEECGEQRGRDPSLRSG
jgi:protein SCO1/2